MEFFFLCLKIFCARIMDVSLGTVRTLFIVKGNKITAGLIAFVEVFIWFFAAREALTSEVNSILIVASYSGGYAMGTFIGTFINEQFISGIYSIQVITDKISLNDIDKIKEQNFGVSIIPTADDKNLLFIEIDKKKYRECIKLLKSLDPYCFIVVNDSKVAHNGYIKRK